MLAAKAAGLPMREGGLHTLVSGGSFGRRANAYSDFTVAAVNVAKAIGGRAPVRLQYTREDDMAAGFYRPMIVHAVKAALDAQGPIVDWQHTIVGQSILAGTPMEAMMKDGVDPTSVEGVSPTVLRAADDERRGASPCRWPSSRCGGARWATPTPPM